MHPYIPYLLNDIKAAERPNGPIEKLSSVQTFEEEMEEIERWVAGENDPEHPFGYYCGLESQNFPPADQLTDKEIRLVCKAFKHLLFTWNSGIDLPDKLPIHLKYKFMVNTLNEGFTVVNSGFMDFDYCSGYAPDCIFGKYCNCIKYWKEEAEDKK